MKPLIDAQKFYPIYGYEGLYEINASGVVRSIDRYVEGRNGLIKGRVLAPSRSGPYLSIALYKEGKCKRFTIHRLVAIHFVPDEGEEVNHKDGNKHNNHYSNLEWVDRVGNSLHSTRMLGKNRGSSNKASKLTESQVQKIKFMLEQGYTQTYIAKLYNVTAGAIHRIAKGHNWSWVDGKEFSTSWSNL